MRLVKKSKKKPPRRERATCILVSYSTTRASRQTQRHRDTETQRHRDTETEWPYFENCGSVQLGGKVGAVCLIRNKMIIEPAPSARWPSAVQAQRCALYMI